MPESEADRYLARLDAALADVRHDTAVEIRAGVAEELAGLDDAAARDRIAALGDPAFIAASARGELPQPSVPVPTYEGSGRLYGRGSLATRGMVIATGLVIAFGGIVLPFVGWVAGIVMMCLSPVWRRAEKVYVAVVPPLVIAGVLVLTQVTPNFPGGWRTVLLPYVTGQIIASLLGIWALVRGLARVPR
ncbi:HAAS signaling domain-containing protein [Microbacterium gorillae]|uniref:HAAS signaling domain-containing protein n=1 Tax=Microbacterium gorillae TaxID=1231063 RepID=UPI000590B746|nr:hypothetical protein [Microbacterium gorillae]